MSKLGTLYEARIIPLLDSLRHPLLLAIRLFWGWQFFTTGRGKLANLDRIAEFFGSLGIPLPEANAAFVACLETFGGIALMLGVATRLIAIPLATTMVVAFLTADRDALNSIFTDPDMFVMAEPFLYLLACLILIAFGPGLFSIDALIKRMRRGGEGLEKESTIET